MQLYRFYYDVYLHTKACLMNWHPNRTGAAPLIVNSYRPRMDLPFWVSRCHWLYFDVNLQCYWFLYWEDSCWDHAVLAGIRTFVRLQWILKRSCSGTTVGPRSYETCGGWNLWTSCEIPTSMDWIWYSITWPTSIPPFNSNYTPVLICGVHFCGHYGWRPTGGGPPEGDSPQKPEILVN